jgi:putative ABC transport system substrate-binding protein
MKRRAFIAGVASVAAWPVLTRAQQLPMIGILHSAAAELILKGLFKGLSEAGHAEGQTYTLEFRSAQGQPERLPAFVAELIDRPVAVIVAAGGNLPGLAAKKATTTIPIVFVSGGDPVAGGLVTNMARPGGNLTGVSTVGRDLDAKRLDFLHQLLPAGTAIGALVNPNYADGALQLRELPKAGAAVQRQMHVARAATADEIDTAVAALAQQGAGALVVAQDPFFYSQRARLVAAAARHKLPAIYHRAEFAEEGGLISYGTSFHEGYRQAGLYVAKILAGARPGDLPVLQPTEFDLVINLKTARTLGLEIPTTVLARADEVIE